MLSPIGAALAIRPLPMATMSVLTGTVNRRSIGFPRKMSIMRISRHPAPPKLAGEQNREMRALGTAALSDACGMRAEPVETLTDDGRTIVMRVATPRGDAVAKWSSLPQTRSRAEAAAHAGTVLRQAGYPAPDVWCIADIAGGTLWLQRALAGTPGRLAHSQAAAAVRLNRCQGGLVTVPFGRDWNAEIHRVHDERPGAGDDGDMDSLWRSIDVVLPTPARLRNSTDLVHGDFHPGNFLFEGDAISGVVDWDGAGHGSRAIDLAQLLCDLYDSGDDDGPAGEVLVASIVQCEGVGGLLTVVAAEAVRSALWGLAHGPGPSWSVGWGARALHDLAG